MEQIREVVDDFTPMIPFDAILGKEQIEGDLFEYKLGSMGAATKYIQRFGTPGQYVYIYPSKRFQRFSKKIRAAYARFLKKSRGFLNKFKVAYEGTSIHVRPKTWHTAIIDVNKKDGGILQFKVNLKAHGIYSYRSKRGQLGAAVKLGRAKKRGILRYR